MTRERQSLQPRFLTPNSCVKLLSLSHWESQLLLTLMPRVIYPVFRQGLGQEGLGVGSWRDRSNISWLSSAPPFVLGPEIPHRGCPVPEGAACKFKLDVQRQISMMRCSWGKRQSAYNVPKLKRVGKRSKRLF